MSNASGERYYNECPRCRSHAIRYVARPLLLTGAGFSPDDLLPEYREDCKCVECWHFWSQRRKGNKAVIIQDETT